MSNTLKFGNGQWGTKVGSALAYNDEDGNFKPLPFDFTRSTSGTRINKDGLIEVVTNNKPRIDFKDDAKGALLLEPTRSNIVTYSEDFINGWNNTGSVITENQSISPDGSLNADLIELNSDSNRLAAVFSSAGGTYTFSFYIKAKEGESGIWRTRVNGDSTIWQNTEVNDTEWTRVTQTFTKTGSGTIVVYPAYRIDGTSTLFNAYIYGAQLEVGSYATSYIPTQGSSVTRVADVCNNGGNNQVINSTEGVLYAEISALANDLSSKYITLSDGTNAKRIIIATTGTSNQVRVQVVDTSSQIEIFSTLSNITTLNKLAFSFKQNEFKFYVNGVLAGIDTSGSVPSGLNVLKFSNADNGVPFYGKTKDLRVYNTALDDAELQALTQ